MDEFNESNESVDMEILRKHFAKEKNDIVCGFLKEKEIIEIIHREEIDGLVAKHEQEKESMRKEFQLEKQNLLQVFQKQQVENLNEFKRERENLETKTAEDFQSRERSLEIEYKEVKLKMRREYEDIIANKNEEIRMIQKELLSVEHQENESVRQSPESDIYITKLEHNEELKRLTEKLDADKLELERKFDREKAKLLQVFSNQAERTNANFNHVIQRMQEDHEKELEFKLEITEKLLSEKSDLARKRMLRQFEREIKELREGLELSFNEKLLEKQQTIDDLEREKRRLLDALHTERFSLARIYNREMSLLTKPDHLTKEDVEVALIDETAKLKQHYEDELNKMEEQHKQKIEVIRRKQRPLWEAELQHRKEIENLKKDFENENERLEAEFRKEQFNLLKSFEFEKNDLQQQYEEILNEKEFEMQQREDDMRQLYEEELVRLKSIVVKQREELEISKEKLTDLADQTEEFLSQKKRIEEKFLKENNQRQSLQQTVETNIRTYERNMKEIEAFHEKELDQLRREKEQLQQIKTENMDLQMEINALKVKLEEVQMVSENAAELSTSLVIESYVGDSYKKGDIESTPTETKNEIPKHKKEQINDCLQNIRERLRKCMNEEKEPKTLEEFEVSNKQMKDAINQAIAEIDKICGGKEEDENDSVILLGEELMVSLEEQMQAVDDILAEGNTKGNIDQSIKDGINTKVKEVLKKVHRLHELQKLKLKEEQQEELSKVLKELTDEKRAKVKESIKYLKHLQDTGKRRDRSPVCVEIRATEERGTSTDDLHQSQKEETSLSSLDLIDELRREKEEMKRAFDELEKVFTKDKEDLMEKLQTQHNDFVMCAEGEIIEKLLKQKSSLEEAFNTERFYLSRLYYNEMKEELEFILSWRTDKMKREFNRDKMNLILKYERQIAELQKVLSEKDELEFRLLQDRNDITTKLLATHKKSSPESSKREQLKETEKFERDKENLEIAIPLKKEIAELQNKRHQEHETAVANLKEATDLIKDIINSVPLMKSVDGKPFDRLSFLSEDPTRPSVLYEAGKPSANSVKSPNQALLPGKGIHNREELRKALEILVGTVVNEDEEFMCDSETTSGTSSDLESEDSGTGALSGDIDEGAYSGPESNEEDTFNIKKKQLEFAFNLERFNLGRIYYGEYKDSLRKAMKKLAQTKEALRIKRKDLESEMLNGIKEVVCRTQFGEGPTQATNRDVETQTAKEVKFEKRSEDFLDGQQLAKIEKEDAVTESSNEDDSRLTDFKEDLESDQEGKKEENVQEKDLFSREILPKSAEEHSSQDERQYGNDGRNYPATGKSKLECSPGDSIQKRSADSPKPYESKRSPVTEEGRFFAHDLGAIEEEKEEDKHRGDVDDAPLQGLIKGRLQKKTDKDGGIEDNDVPFEQQELPTKEKTSSLSTTKEHQEEEKEDKGEDSGIINNEELVVEPEYIENREAKAVDDKDKKKFKDQSADGNRDLESKRSPIAETDVADEEDIDNFRSRYHTKPDNQEKRQRKDQTSDEGEGKGDILEDSIPDVGEENTTLKEKLEELPEGIISKGEKEIEGGVINAISQGKKAKEPRKERKEIDKYAKEDSSEETDYLDGILTAGIDVSQREKAEYNPAEANSSEDKENLQNDSEPKKVKRGKKRRGRKGGEGNKSLTPKEDEEDDDLKLNGRESPVSDQDLIEQLNRNYEILQDKFNILCELVGKGFVYEIPELNNGRKQGDLNKPIENLHGLYKEKEQLVNELKKIDLQMKELTESSNDKVKELNIELEKKELELLHSLEETEKHLKKNSDKKLVEHLLKEKEDVSTKLDEINNILNEKKEEMKDLGSYNVETVPGLMYKRDWLRNDLIEKTREVNSKCKLLETASHESEKEIESLENIINSCKVQLAALKDSSDRSSDTYPFRVGQLSKELPAEIAHLLRRKADAEQKAGELDKTIKKAENDIKKCQRLSEEHTDRLKPFQRKKVRLEETLKLVNQREDEAKKGGSISAKEATDYAGDAGDKSGNDALMDGFRANDRDQYSSKNQRKEETEKQIQELNAAIRNIELPFALDYDLTNDAPSLIKLEIIGQAKLKKEKELQILEAEITEEQNKLRKAYSVDPAKLSENFERQAKIKEEIAKLFDHSQLPLKEHNDVTELQSLLSIKGSLEEQVTKLEREIWEEQSNFLEACQFKRDGRVKCDTDSKIKELLDTKDKLEQDLNDTNNTILQSLSSGGLVGPHTQFLEECVAKKVKLEEEITRLHNHIADETLRASKSLVDIIEKKRNVSEDLKEAKQRATDELKRVQLQFCGDVEHNNYDSKVNDVISQARSALGQGYITIPEWQGLRQKQEELEQTLRENGECLVNAKKRGQDSSNEEQAVECVIREKISVDKKLQDILEESSNKETVCVSEDKQENESDQSLQSGNLNADLNGRRRELEDRFCINERQLDGLLRNAGLFDNDVEKLKSLSVGKVELEEDLERLQFLEDMLLKKDNLQEQLGNEQPKSDECRRTEQIEGELEKLNALIDRRENEAEKIETKKTTIEEKLKNLSDEKEKWDKTLKSLNENITEATKEVEVRLEEAQINLSEYEKRSVEERQALQNDLEAMRGEIERCSKDEKELERQLQRRKKELIQTNGNVFHLEKLLTEKESLREYLVEIDATLDKTEIDTDEQKTLANTQELAEKKKELEKKLKDIRNEKLKMDVEFEEEEIHVAMEEIHQMKKDLVKRDTRVSDQIRELGVIGKLVERRKHDEGTISRYFIQGIIEAMTRDEKTLTELLKENEEFTNAAQKERDNVIDAMALLKGKVGEDLANALISSNKEAQTDKDSQALSAVEEIEVKEVTISDLLKDIGEDNKKLRVINEELSSELATLQEKIGEELSKELSKSLPVKYLQFGYVVSTVQEDGKTLEDILHENNERMHTIEDLLGNGLFNAILWKKDKADTKENVDTSKKLKAPALMSEFHEDLEHVIAVYETKLESLSQEHDVLTERLGGVLLQEILDLGKITAKPKKIYGTQVDPQTSTADGEEPFNEKDFRGESKSLEDSKDDKFKPKPPLQDQRDVKALDTKGGELSEDTGSLLTQVEKEITPRLYNMCLPYFTYRQRQGVSASPAEANVKGYLKAPKIMQGSGKTLGEIIAKYESDLQRSPNEWTPVKYLQDADTSQDLKGPISPPKPQEGPGASPRRKVNTYESTIPEGMGEIGMKLQGIAEAQDKNLEMLQMLKERLGEDLVDALITETEHKENYDFLTDGKGDEPKVPENEGLGESICKRLGETPDERTNKEIRNRSSNHVGPRERSNASTEDRKGHSNDQSKGVNVKKIKAPSIALENKKTLADVIASYEKALDLLQSKLGPSLTRIVLSMEDPTITEGDDVQNQEKAKKIEEKTSLQDNAREYEQRPVDEKIDGHADKLIDTFPELVTSESERNTQTPLRAAAIMETSGKTLEKIIEDYEQLIDKELKQMEDEVTTLKERLGSDLYDTLLNKKNGDYGTIAPGTGITFPKEEETGLVHPEANNSESVKDEVDVPADDLQAKSLLEQGGMTVEDVLRSYEKQLEELLKLVPNEAREGDSIIGLLSSYEGRLADLECENKTFSDRIANLFKRIGPDLAGKLEHTENREEKENQDVEEYESLNAPMVMKNEGKTLEDVVRNYEKELDVLKNKSPIKGNEMTAISDIIKEYEDKIDDFKKRNVGLQEEHVKLVRRIGHDLVEDILSLKLAEVENVAEKRDLAHSELLAKAENNYLTDHGRLNAPIIMGKEDSTLENVLEIYEKALGILPCYRAYDDSFAIHQIHSFEDLERQNKILRDALGDRLAAYLIVRADDGVPQAPYFSKDSENVEPQLLVREADNAENQLTDQEEKENETPFPGGESNQIKALEVMRGEGTTIEKILKDYENEISALRKLFPSDTNEATSMSDLVKSYEDRIERLENEKTTFSDMVGELTKIIGPGLMDELQHLNSREKERQKTTLRENKHSDLTAPNLMQSESRTLEEVVRKYENELVALRRLMQNEGDVASSLSDIIASYEDKLKDCAEEFKSVENRFLELQVKIGFDLVDELDKLEIKKPEQDETLLEISAKDDRIDTKDTVKLRAPNVMNDTKLPLEDILATYEENLHRLERENKVYQESLGHSIAKDLLNLAKERETTRSENVNTLSSSTQGFDNKDSERYVTVNERKGDREFMQAQSAMTNEEESHEFMEQAFQSSVERDVKSDGTSGASGLKAINLLREEGNDIEGILKIYEKEIEALKRLQSEGAGEIISVSDLIEDYESKINDLETNNAMSVERLKRLEKLIGQDVFCDLDNWRSGEKRQDQKMCEDDNKSDLEALIVMANNNRTLENVLKNYEKELSALRKLHPAQNDERRSLSDIIKECEDKIEKMERENEDFESEFKVLEDKIGANLLGEIMTMGPSEPDSEKKVGGLNILTKMKENDWTLENVLVCFEKDLDDLSKENKLLKDSLGPQLVQILLSMADKKKQSEFRDTPASRDKSKAGDEGVPPVEESQKKDLETADKKDAISIRSRPLDKNNNNEVTHSTDLSSRVLKAESLITNDGNTIENILRNYERQLEVLTELAPDSKENVVSKLVKEYEDLNQSLENENNNLVNRLENLEKAIGIQLLNEVENKRLKGTTKLQDSNDNEIGDSLMAPEIMEKEGRTLENVVKAYERELDVLRNFRLSEDENRSAITDLVKNYEDKLDQLKGENKRLADDLRNLEKKIGYNLVKKLEETVVGEPDDQQLDIGEATKDLKVTKIMVVKKSTLEDVLQTYESALGVLLSDASNFIADPENIVADQTRTMNKLREENDFLKRAVGPSLSQTLINIGKGGAEIIDEQTQVSKNESDVDDTIKSINKSEMDVKQPPLLQNKTAKDELNAERLVREEGRTIENILKNYERELETWKSVVPEDSGQTEETFSDLIRKYEDEKEKLEKTNKSLVDKMEFLENNIGLDLIKDIEDKGNLSLRERRSEMNAPVIMEEEDRTLEAVITCYEKELNALRKVAVSQQDDKISISDIIKDYEDKVEDLKNENKSLKYELDKLTRRLGSGLVEHIRKLDDNAQSESESKIETQSTLEAADGTHPRKLREEIKDKKPLLIPESQDNDKVVPGSDGLTAKELLRDEGITIENILKNYEQEIEALSKVVSEATNLNFSISNLETSYEKKIEELKVVNSGLEKRMENLTEKIGKDLAKALEREEVGRGDANLLQQEEHRTDVHAGWKAVQKIKEDEKTLTDILESYENDLEKLQREKSAMKALLSNESDGLSALDIMSQCEDEIIRLKDANKDYENKLSTLFGRIGDSLVRDILTLPHGKEPSPGYSIEALKIMAIKEKPLSAVLDQYEDDLKRFTRENEYLKSIASKEEVDGKQLNSLVSEYEDKIQNLTKAKNDSESSLRLLTEKVGETLVNEIISTQEEGGPLSLGALEIMKSENKCLADVVEKYEDDLDKLHKQISLMRDLASKDPETTSFIDKISEYEDEISALSGKIKEQALLEMKVGIELSKQLTALAKFGTGKSQESTTLKAVTEMERSQDSTVADILKDYETELENKSREISAMKELISGDMLEIAASQEGEIHELKKVKSILDNELDAITDKVGKELLNELLKKSTRQPDSAREKLYREVVEKMEDDGKPLGSIIEDYDREIKLIMGINEELTNKELVLTEKIGKDLVVELVRGDLLRESIKTETKALFEAVELMSTENKPLADVILLYEKEIAKLKRENGALHLLTETESSQETSVIDLLSDYEEQIERIEAEKTELYIGLQKLTQRVGVQLTEELLKLPDDVCESASQAISELGALTILKENKATLTEVLQMYERKLREGDGVYLGPLVSRTAIMENIKFANFVRVEREPQVVLSEEGPFEGVTARDDNVVDTTLQQEQDQIKNREEISATLRQKQKQLSREVDKEMSQVPIISREDTKDELKTAIKSSAVQDLEALNDIINESAEGLENHGRKLDGPLGSSVGVLGVGHIKEEEIKPARLLRVFNGGARGISDFSETETVSQYTGKNEEDVEDTSDIAELCDLDISYLVQVVDYPGESLFPIPDKEMIHEEVTKVDRSKHEHCLSCENLEKLFSSDIAPGNRGDLGERADAELTENKGESVEGTSHKRIMELEQELKEQKLVTEKYEKDIQDLLKDIVDLKMRQADAVTENPEKGRQKAQEEVDLMQDNKRLQRDLKEEKERRLSMEEIKRDLVEKVDNLMQENELLRQQRNDAQNMSTNERTEICHINETGMASHYSLPRRSLTRKEDEEPDSHTDAKLNDLEIISLRDLIPETPVTISHPIESSIEIERETIEEEIIRVKLPEYKDTINPDFIKSLFGYGVPLEETGNVCKESDVNTTKSKGQFRDGEITESLEKRIKELEQELVDEKRLREKYEKDIQDLLQDIVDLKMMQAGNGTESSEEARKKVKEEVDMKLDNKRLQEDLEKERTRRLSTEESKRDLLDEVDTLIREREVFRKQQSETKDGKLLEDMISLRKKIGELGRKDKNLNKEVEELRESIKGLEVSHQEEKSQMLRNFEKEKSEIMDELVTSKSELETQLQELFAMNDDLKRTIKSLLEELNESNEKVATEGERRDKKECEEIKKEREVEEKDANAAYVKKEKENLKERDETQNAVQQTLKTDQREITSVKTEGAKRENELRQEIEILSNKLELAKYSAEQQKKDFENVIRREKERIKDDMELELEREKKKRRLDFEDREDDLRRKIKKLSTDLQEQEEQWKQEKGEIQQIFRNEKEKLQKAFDEELRIKMLEKEEQHRQSNEQMNRDFEKEKMGIMAAVEKKIYEKLLDKNIAAETDFQGVLSKILQEHSKEIEGVENDIRKAEERFKEDTNRLIEQTDKEKEALKKTYEEEKKALEVAVQNLLKEVVKLKHQRKEMRMIHKKEKESLEEIYERDRITLKEDWEKCKKEILEKMQDEFDCKLADETRELQTRLEDMKRELKTSEHMRKELEDILRRIPHENEHQISHEQTINEKTAKDRQDQVKELKSAKKQLEEEYEKKLKEEKRRFEDTLKALRREIGSLQEKRRFIQDKLYNQDPSVTDRHSMEKSLANYKREMLSKMEEEVSQKIAREKKPLEETIKELQDENDDLKRQRWELRNQLRRERSKLEDQFELERENMEKQFLKVKEELKDNFDTRIQREMAKRTLEEKVTRALSPILSESQYGSQDSPRGLRSENTALRDDKHRLEREVRQLTSKLETLEASFQEMKSSEKTKAEKMKKIQAKMPKKVTFSEDLETRSMDYAAGDHNETILQELRERDIQVRELLEAKYFYEEVLTELCEEAGLFELDQNVVI